MPVRVEKNGYVTTVILDRKEVRNAVDRQTAQALADAFRAFDEDEEARVGVFWGAAFVPRCVCSPQPLRVERSHAGIAG